MPWNPPATGAAVSLFNSSGTATLAGGTTTSLVTLVPVNQYNSYDLSLLVVDALQGTANHSLTCQVTIAFYDDLLTGIPVFVETWNPWVKQTFVGGLQGVIGTGPMHGQYMTITIANSSAFNVTLEYFNLYGSPRIVEISDWRMATNNHVTDNVLLPFTNFGSGFENVLGELSGEIALGVNTYWLPLHLYSGPVSWTLFATAAIHAVSINDIGTQNQLSGAVNNAIGILADPQVTAAGSYFGTYNSPRSACALVIATTVAVSVEICVTGQQGP